MTNIYSEVNQAEDAPQTPPAASGGGNEKGGALNAAGKGNILLAGLLVAGLAGVWLLGARTGPEEAAGDEAEDAKTDALVSHLAESTSASGALAADTEKMVDRLFFEADRRQIPKDRLQRNPFRTAVPRPAEPEEPPAAEAKPDSPDTEHDPEPVEPPVDGYTIALEKAEELELQMVMADPGGRSMAMISNNLLTRGQTISGWTIEEIHPEDVVLRWQDKTYVLRLR